MKPYVNLLFRIYAKIRIGFIVPKKMHWKNIPIIINNFNRLEFLQQQLAWLNRAGMKNIYIIDNNSSYPPLLEFYKKTSYTVFKLDKNVGHLALWKTHIFKWFENQFYVYTDPDIVPVDECPFDAVNQFMKLLQQYPAIEKVGFGLKIDDIPDYYEFKTKVINWEKQYWERELEPNVYEAKIDTTFALYRPQKKGGWELAALRTGGKLIAAHLPWYVDSQNISSEEIYFKSITTNVSSWYTKNHYQ